MLKRKKIVRYCILSCLCFTAPVLHANNFQEIERIEIVSEKNLSDQVEYFKIGVWEENIDFEWKVISEREIQEYILEYSTNGNDFIELARRASTGNSIYPVVYEKNVYNKMQAADGIYRLKQVNKQGNIKYTQVKYTTLENSESKDISLTIHPNPSYKAKKTLRLEQLNDNQLQVEITDHRGYRISSTTIKKERDLTKKNSEVIKDLNLQNGVYYMKIYGPKKKIVRKFYIK